MDKFLGKFLQGRLLHLVDHDLHHLLSNLLSLGTLGIAGGFDLSTSSLGEANSKQSEHVSIRGLGLNEGFNDCVPFLDKLAQLVSCYVHTIEVSKAIEVFNFFNLNLNLSPSIGVGLVL